MCCCFLLLKNKFDLIWFDTYVYKYKHTCKAKTQHFNLHKYITIRYVYSISNVPWTYMCLCHWVSCIQTVETIQVIPTRIRCKFFYSASQSLLCEQLYMLRHIVPSDCPSHSGIVSLRTWELYRANYWALPYTLQLTVKGPLRSSTDMHITHPDEHVYILGLYTIYK